MKGKNKVDPSRGGKKKLNMLRLSCVQAECE